MYSTPILLIIFNRPETTRQVFEVIREQKPKYLFVAADGPRTDHKDDAEKCKAARDEIKVDWDCELKTLYRDKNFGCGRGPASAISWFFNEVEQGIILEDDIIPDLSFFLYCDELLDRYKYDSRIAMISGINLLSPWKTNEASYIFSYMGGIPGWATWRRAWLYFDYTMSEWKTDKTKRKIKNLLYDKAAFNHFSRFFDYFSSTRREDVWDYQWLFSRWNAQGCSIVPGVNLMKNIGFGIDATHTVTFDHPQAKIKQEKITLPLNHRDYIIDREYDRLIFNNFVKESKVGILKRVKRIVKSIFTNN